MLDSINAVSAPGIKDSTNPEIRVHISLSLAGWFIARGKRTEVGKRRRKNGSDRETTRGTKESSLRIINAESRGLVAG